MRKGGAFLGELERSGIGTPIETVQGSTDKLGQGVRERNVKLLESLVEDTNSQELLRIARADAELGRMSMPEKLGGSVPSDLLLHPRFGVCQEKSDGTRKCRAVDNFSWSPGNPKYWQGNSKKRQKVDSVNGATFTAEKMHHDTLDALVDAMRMHVKLCGTVPAIFKVDIDSAFRRVPLRPSDRWAAGVAFKVGQDVYVSRHAACPFGAVASVHNWERLGVGVCFIARKYLRLDLLRYVDDMFGVESAETVHHAMECLRRLICILLGRTAVQDKKVECGLQLEVLGVWIAPNADGVECWPAQNKVKKWLAVIDSAIANGFLSAGEASKLAGRLSWAGCKLFRKLGRAMLRPIFNQKGKANGRIDAELSRSLHWWKQVLRLGITETQRWECKAEQPLHLFTDARGRPPHLGAVLFDGSRWCYSHMEAPAHVLSQFVSRKDNQIMGLELLGISLGLSTFEAELRGRAVVVHCDNTGAEVACDKGTARSWDHAQLVHAQWLHAAREHMQLYVKRVATEDNIADLPSRKSFGLLNELGAIEYEAKLDDPYSMPEVWEVLNERWCEGDQRRRIVF